MPKQPTGRSAQGPEHLKPGPTWSAVLQIAVAVAVGTALVAGPQLWAFGDRLKGDWHRWSSDQWPRPVASPVKPPARSTRPARPTVIPVVPVTDPAVKAAARKAVAQPVARPTPSKPKVKPRPQVARTAISAPVLLEPAKDPKTYYEMCMKQGSDLYQAGWYGPAIGRFRLAAAIIPSPSAYLWIGRSAIRAGRPFEARSALERTIALAPDSAAAREAHALLDRLKTEKSSL
ncbi:MAG: hypothetical protein ACRDGN_14135 [bacterium]